MEILKCLSLKNYTVQLYLKKKKKKDLVCYKP